MPHQNLLVHKKGRPSETTLSFGAMLLMLSFVQLNLNRKISFDHSVTACATVYLALSVEI